MLSPFLQFLFRFHATVCSFSYSRSQSGFRFPTFPDAVFALGKIMLRHFTKKCVESKTSKLFMKRCLRLNFIIAKVSQVFLVEWLCYATQYYRTYCIRPGFVWYGRTTTEQSYKFPVCANVGVLFSLDILSQACEKHIETRFCLQQCRFWSITQPCNVSVQCIERYLAKTEPGRIRFQQPSLIKSLNFPILTFYFSCLDQTWLPIAVVPFIYWNKAKKKKTF